MICTSNTRLAAWSAVTAAILAVPTTALAQDECTSAVTATTGVPAPFNTTTATPSANPPTDTQCTGTFLNWGNSADVWFRWVATEGGIASFSTCLAGSYDTSMALYKGASCATATQIACNGDSTGDSGCQQYYSKISDIACTAGDVFYIRIGGYDGATGTGALTVSFSAVAGSCATATGDCGTAHGGLGCNDPVCCQAVCSFNPLCCDVAWDAACVQGAVDACGLFFYNCVPGGPANNCASSATLVTADGSLPFNTVGSTTDGPGHAAATCASGNDFFPNDVWWRFQAGANGTATVSTCGTIGYDNKMAVYAIGSAWAGYNFNDLPDDLLTCIDDGAGGNCFLTDGTTPYAAALSFTVQAGQWYLVRMASYTEGETGSGSIAFNLPEPCQLDAPTQAELEACGTSANNGCNATGETEPIQVGSTVNGTFWANGGQRDTDFYRLSIANDTNVTVEVKSASFARVLILGGNIAAANCAGISTLATGAGACPATATACLGAGEYYIFVGPSAADGSPVFEGNACGNGVFNNYSLKVTGAPATCPIVLATSCANPGPNTATINNDATAANGLVACAVGGAAGGSTINSYARVFQASTVGGEISCLNFGIFSVRVTAAGNTASDLPLPGRIGIYRDTDGGAPTRKQVTSGDGGDLIEIFGADFFAPGGAYLATLNLTEPLCITDYAGSNLVVILDTPNLYAGVGTIPGASGYQLRPAGNTAGPGQNTYCRLSCADGAGQYVTTETLGATFTAQWVVQINGNFSQCSGGGNDCPADLNNDGTINGFDLSAVLAGWGSPAGDTNGDGTTNGIDITTVLSAWNTNCP